MQEESFMSHLTELRDRMVRALLVVLVFFGASFYFAPQIMEFLARPLTEALPPGSKAIFIDQAGAFFTLTKIALLTALLISLPVVLYQAWAFIAPGLYEHEKRFVMPLILSSVFFLVVGIGFAYLFVLPAAYKFFFSFTQQTGAETLQDLQKYWDFTLAIFFGFGLTFEVPVVQMLLVKVGLVSTQQLREARRYVIVGAF
ncbi:MAG: twin-arginine translocase subunit TatC, partial [Betaproteobacteria bacterium]|nr:twin-arginine translocase subunit TatC [Betaproteobacteria bacterium]